MRRVLIVDDDLELAATLVEKFTREGWIAESVVGGNAAFELVEKGGIDLVISDLRMPNGTGIELLRKLKRFNKGASGQVPVIIMTGLLDGGEAYLRSLGAKEVLLKSMPLDIFLKSAEKLFQEQK
jgi:CheY-like chemotaxis protein